MQYMVSGENVNTPLLQRMMGYIISMEEQEQWWPSMVISMNRIAVWVI